MTKDEIISMMRQACDPDKVDAWNNDFWAITQPELERFANLVAAHEREACAKVCDQSAEKIWEFHPEYVNQVGKNVCENLAAAIRFRVGE